MGSKKAKGKGRSTETKTRNRGKKKLYIPPTLNVSKADKLVQEYQKNGLTYVNVHSLFEGVKSLKQLRRKVGEVMEERHLSKPKKQKVGKREFIV